MTRQPTNHVKSIELSRSRDNEGGRPEKVVIVPVKQIASPAKAAGQDPRAQTIQPSPYELRGLFAQEEMADLSYWMMVAAFLTFIVTSLGTFFIWRQVSLTRQAVEDTAEATDAMREANRIAAQAVGTERPWICPNGINSGGFLNGAWNDKPVKDGVAFSLIAGNLGRSPAVNVGMVVAHDVLSAEGEVEIENPLQDISNGVHSGVVGPGASIETQLIVLDDELTKRFRNREITVRLKCRIVYRDTFSGATHTSEFGWTASHRGGTKADGSEAILFQVSGDNILT